MTESIFSNKDIIIATLKQIQSSILQLEEWNFLIKSVDDYLTSADGMKTLAASSMLLEAIGEGIKRIDKRSGGQLLKSVPEIPWDDVMGLRDHIAHGYFDLDAEIIYETIRHDLRPFLKAINKLLIKAESMR